MLDGNRLMWGYELTDYFLSGETILSSDCSQILFITYALVSLAIPILLGIFYYINDLLVIWDELTLNQTIPTLMAEGVLVINVLVSFLVLSSYNRSVVRSIYPTIPISF